MRVRRDWSHTAAIAMRTTRNRRIVMIQIGPLVLILGRNK